jgi:hypothetical protein
MLRRVDRILIRVPNVASAVAYYRQTLGLSVLREGPKVATLKFPDDAVEIVLHADADLPAEAVYFLVDDVRDLYRRRAELKLTFTSAPSRVARGYRAVVKDPFGTVLQILDRTGSSSERDVEDAKSPGALFDDVERRATPKRDLLVKLYEQIGRTADDLPYTPHFESLYLPYVAQRSDPKPDRAEVWRHLLNLRKAGKLPKLGDAKSKPPAVPGDARQRLKALLGKDLGKRDRLPYTQRFDDLVDQFNKTIPRALSPHQVWRVVATLAK